MAEPRARVEDRDAVAPALAEESEIRGMEMVVGRVLLVGVVVSLALLLLGSVLFFARDDSGYGPSAGNTAALTHSPSGAVSLPYPHSVSAVLRGAAHGRPFALIALGLLALIATPVVLLVVTLIGFIRARDRAYIAISAIVLAVLLISFALGKAG